MDGRVQFTIGTLAKAAGVGVETIRFYQRRGLLPEPSRPPGGIRRYGSEQLARIRFVKAAQNLGFTLDEIQDLLTLDDGTGCGEARRLAERKLADVVDRLDDLRRIEAALRSMVDRCARSSGRIKCPLIASLSQTT